MLNVLRLGDRFDSPCTLLLGGFDGFHIGHETLLRAAREMGLPVGLTAVGGGKAGGELFLFSERERIFERLGFSFCIELPFTERLKQTSAKDFLQQIFDRVCVKLIVCGEDFRFGKGAEGTPALLKRLAPCPVRVLPLQYEDGEKVASGRIKRLLGAGELSAANKLLSVNYFLHGIVEHGREVGRTYGFPTVNLSLPAEKFSLPDGVYGGVVQTDTGNYPAIINFGARPTFGVEERKAEAYLDGFSGDLYDQTVEIVPKEFYRPIRKFDTKEALKEQLELDIKRLREKAREE